MKEYTFIAGKLRQYGIEIPAHIPSHAWIFERDTQNVTVGGSWADGRITSVRNWPTFPPEKFHFYRLHGTARLLVSRNRREGRYCGHSKMVVQHGFVMSLEKARHRRVGCNIYAAPLRNSYK